MTQIRPAREADVAVICSFDHIAAGSAERREFIAHAVTAGHAWVALAGEEVVAYAVLEYTFFGQGFISMVYVHPGYRNRGVGSSLVRHLEGVCATAKLFTSTNQSNLLMQALLARLGFQPSGRIDNLDEGDPELVFFKPVREQDDTPPE